MSHDSLMWVHQYYSERVHYALDELKSGKITTAGSDKWNPRPGSSLLFAGVFDDKCLISAWPELIPEIENLTADLHLPHQWLLKENRDRLTDLCIRKLGSDAICYTYSGIWLYCSKRMYDPMEDPNVHPITRSNAGRVISDLLDDGISTDVNYLLCDDAAFAYFVEDRAVSYAGTHPVGAMSDRIGNLMVGTHRSFRRRGYGKAVVSATTGKLIEQGRTAVYGTTEDNVPSIRTAQSLGYRIYCHRFEVRLAYS